MNGSEISALYHKLEDEDPEGDMSVDLVFLEMRWPMAR